MLTVKNDTYLPSTTANLEVKPAPPRLACSVEGSHDQSSNWPGSCSVHTTQEEGLHTAAKLVYLFYSFYHSKNPYHLNHVLFSRSNSVLIHSNYVRFLN
jgi:hypothetical protein